MTPQDAKNLLPPTLHEILKSVPPVHWEEFAMLWSFHEEHISMKKKMRAMDRKAPIDKGFIKQVLILSPFQPTTWNINMCMVYVTHIEGREITDQKVETIIDIIAHCYDNYGS